METADLLARIEAAYDDALALFEQWDRQSTQAREAGDIRGAMAAKITAASQAAVVRALAIVLERDVPPLPTD